MAEDQWRVDLVPDVATFEAVAGHLLAADPVATTVVATQVERSQAAEATAPVDPAAVVRFDDAWWAVVRGPDGRVEGVGMHSATVGPYVYVLGMPHPAATALAAAVAALTEGGTEVQGVNGARPASDIVAGHLAERAGGRAEVDVQTRLFRCDTVQEPPLAAGRLRPATADDHDLATAWYAAFAVDAATQGGRSTAPGMTRDIDADVAARTAAGCLWFWDDANGRPVHFTAANPPAYGASRIGPVYTPAEHRGRGYAAAAVAEVTRGILAAGATPCLFTDQANPVSNEVYERIGYRAVTDMANLRIVR